MAFKQQGPRRVERRQNLFSDMKHILRLTKIILESPRLSHEHLKTDWSDYYDCTRLFCYDIPLR